MKTFEINEIFLQNLWTLLNDLDGEYIEASNQPCTCGTNEEHSCPHCAKWMRVANKVMKMRDRVGQLINKEEE